jgi:HEAT repeat protein
LRYFPTVVGVQAVGGVGLAVLLGFLGRGFPQVERLRDAGDTAGLAQLLREGNPPERQEAARALGALGSQEARPALLAALQDPDAAVRRHALAALVGRARPEDRPRLEALQQHPDRRTQRLAREVLHWIE